MTITQIERQITNLEIEDHIANSDQIDHLKKMKGQLVMVRLAKSLKRK